MPEESAADGFTMSEVAKWIAPVVASWLLQQTTGDDSGGYASEQKRLVESQAQMAELMAQIVADRYYNVEQPYSGAIMGNVMGFGNQLLDEGRNKITAPGIQ